MAKPKLTYFDFSGSRGEECRLALAVAGIDFEDDRLAPGTWPDVKDTTPFGSLPILEIEGKGRIAECNAILTLIGRKHGVHPTDLWEAARHEALMSAVEMLRSHLTAATVGLSDDEKKAAREKLLEGVLPRFARGVEAELGDGPFLAGADINVADIKLYMIVRSLTTGVIDHIPSTLFDDFPRLMKLFAAVGEHPKVVAWTSR